MARPFDVVTFDCYGTLVDWEGGISSAFQRAAAAAGMRAGRDAILAAHAEIEPVVQAECYRLYREVLRRTAVLMARRLGWRIDADGADFLPDSLAAWIPFEDTRPALRRMLGAGYRLGILSNVDHDLFAATREVLDVDFEPVVTAEDVRSYKPDRAHFDEARRRIGTSRWLHAAQSWFHDVVPASELAIPVAWINRHGEPPAGRLRPDHEFRDLAELADFLV